MDDLSVRHGDVWREPRRRSEIARYAAAAVAVLAGIAALGHGMAGQPPGPAALATDDAVMVDLAPAPPSSAPERGAEDGPEQQASAAVPVAPPASPDAPRDTPPPDAPDADVEDSKPKAPAVPPPPPPAPAAVERAPSGTLAPVPDAPMEMSEDARPAEAHAVDLWQRAMAMRLEVTKRRLAHAVHAAGKAVVGFTIDRDGRLAGSRIVTSSGCLACDAVALKLVAASSPYPVPPAALSEHGLSFTVPVRFNAPR